LTKSTSKTGLHSRGEGDNCVNYVQFEADNPLSENKLTLRPLIGLMGDQPPEEVERHVVREIGKHRRLRDEAVLLEAQVNSASDSETAHEANHAYISAMIAVHAQQTVVSTLLDILGYIPDLPKTQAH
jgi:hypothetical protein